MENAMHVRDLHETNPDDYSPGSFDIACKYAGILYYTDDIYTTRDAAEIALAGFEMVGPDACVHKGLLVPSIEQAAK